MLTVRIDNSYSLKEKRQVVHGVMDHLRHHYPLSVAEVGHHRLYNLTEIGISMVNAQSQIIERIFEKVITRVEDRYPIEIIEIDTLIEKF